MSDISPGPPNYMYHDTCAICWEPCGYSMLGDWWDRWRHRRKFGHNPEGINARRRAEYMAGGSNTRERREASRRRRGPGKYRG